MKKLTLAWALILTMGACGGSGSDSDATTTDPGAGSTTTTAGSVTSSTADTTDTTSGDTPGGTAGTTDTTSGDTSGGTAEFVISRVVFGDAGYVSITNVGDATGNLEGWQLCQRPAYFGIGSVEVAAGETVHITTGGTADLTGQVVDSGGRFGRLNAGDGEMALYIDGSFGSSLSIRSYVEWGDTGHGRSSVAVDAGIWDGGFVETTGAPGIAATVDTATTAADWATS